MTYYCSISKECKDMFVVRFPDMPNVITYGTTEEHALRMAKEALEAVLETAVEYNMEIPGPECREGYPVAVDSEIAIAIESRRS